jgi:proteasome lid subunit RPN8/RPN11
MISLKQTDFERMLAHARQQAPEEACGLLGGTIDSQGDRHIEKVYLLENIDHTNEHFSLDPKDQLLAVKDMRANGLIPLGNWHSHPESPSRPSQEDIRLAYDKNASYLILSLMEPEHPVLNSFHVEEGQVTKENLVYV